MRQPAVVNLVRSGAYWCILVLLAGLVALAGCGSKKPQVPQDQTADNWPPAQFAIGETASDGKLAVTVTSARILPEIPASELKEDLMPAPGQPLRPETEGNVFLLVGIGIENVSQAPQYWNSPRVMDLKGQEWTEGFTSTLLRDEPEGLKPIAIGESTSGSLLFEVPTTTEHPMLRFAFDVGAHVYFDLAQ